MKFANIAKQVNMGASKIFGNKMPVKLMGGIALSAILGAAVVLPSSAAYGANPFRPLTEETRISYEQLVDDLGEWGQFPRAATVSVPFHDQLVDDLGEFLRVTNNGSVTSHDQMADDLGER